MEESQVFELETKKKRTLTEEQKQKQLQNLKKAWEAKKLKVLEKKKLKDESNEYIKKVKPATKKENVVLKTTMKDSDSDEDDKFITSFKKRQQQREQEEQENEIFLLESKIKNKRIEKLRKEAEEMEKPEIKEEIKKEIKKEPLTVLKPVKSNDEDKEEKNKGYISSFIPSQPIPIIKKPDLIIRKSFNNTFENKLNKYF
jgi:hypothetical protein